MIDDEAAQREPGPEDEDLLEEAQELFELCQEREADNRRDALEDLRFARLEEQWPEKVRRERELEGRPCLVINKLPAIIRQVVNDGRLNKPAISVHPVDSAGDPETAEIMNGLIRHIEQSSDADVAYDTALDFAVSCGFGYFRINTAYSSDDGFEQDIVIERISNPLSVYGDPDSTAADSSDWNTAFVVDRVPHKLFKARYPGAQKVDFTGVEWDTVKTPWGSADDVLIAEWWKREEVRREILALSDGQIIDAEEYAANKALYDAIGVSVVGQRPVRSHKVTQRLISGLEVLETVEWAGRFIPIVPVYGEEINVEGVRHLRSLVRSAMDAQRMFNYWRTTSTELVALAPKAPFIGRKGAFETDAAKWATANTVSHAYIEYDGQDAPQRQPFSGVPAGALQEALNASDDIKAITGIHDASLGARGNETSGRAIMARQREGDVSTFHYIDNLSRAIRHAGRILIDLIPKVYATPRVIRVLGPDGKAETRPVNQPVEEDVKGEDGQVRRIQKIYDLTAGKYDLTVRAGPSFTSRREEAASQMIELIRAYPAAAPLVGDLLARNLDWPGADEIAERLKALLPAQLQGESPEAQQAKQQMQAMAAKIEELGGQLREEQTSRIIDLQDLRIKAFGAETDRLKALLGKDGAAMNPAALVPVVLQSLQMILESPDVLPGQPPQPMAPAMPPQMVGEEQF